MNKYIKVAIRNILQMYPPNAGQHKFIKEYTWKKTQMKLLKYSVWGRMQMKLSTSEEKINKHEGEKRQKQNNSA